MTRFYLNNIGIACALGVGKDKVLRGLVAGDASGVVRVGDILVSGRDIPFGLVSEAFSQHPATLSDYTGSDYTGSDYASRNLQLALMALTELDSDIRALIERYGADRVAVVAGSSTSGIERGEQALHHHRQTGRLPENYHFAQQEMGTVSDSIARHFGLMGPAFTISTACSSGAKTFAAARRLLRADLADAVIVGGADSLCRLTLNGFHALSALSLDACIPFSRNRDGTVLGEGAAFFLMSKDPSAIHFAGIGESSDAHGMTAPDPTGDGAKQAMTLALADAGITPQDLAYVNLHGTGTILNDSMESRALLDTIGDQVPCSSTKAITGHALGAAGAIEAAFCWLLLSDLNRGRHLPPHVWDGAPDTTAPLPGMVKASDRLPSETPLWCMSNSYAFGGSNVSLIIGRDQ